MKTITIILLLFTVALPVSAKECTTMEAFAAEAATDHLKSWGDIYKAYKDYGQCDDGAIAEGFDDKISILWADHWNKLSEMIIYIKRDPGFKQFIYRRIKTEAIPNDRWTTIVSHAKKRCPDGAKEFCRKIIKSKQ